MGELGGVDEDAYDCGVVEPYGLFHEAFVACVQCAHGGDEADGVTGGIGGESAEDGTAGAGGGITFTGGVGGENVDTSNFTGTTFGGAGGAFTAVGGVGGGMFASRLTAPT